MASGRGSAYLEMDPCVFTILPIYLWEGAAKGLGKTAARGKNHVTRPLPGPRGTAPSVPKVVLFPLYIDGFFLRRRIHPKGVEYSD